MKLSQITTTTISTVSNKELLNLHYRIHQLYRLWKLGKSSIDVNMLRSKHSIVSAEMKKRSIRHTTNLEHAIEALFT